MLRVPIAYAKPGMVLAMPVLHPRRPDTVLLKDGIELEAHAIARLAEINLREVWIRYPGTEFLCEYYCPEVLREQGRLAVKVAGAFDQVLRGAHAKLEFNEYRAAISGLIDRLVAYPKSAMFVEELADRDQPALRHASAVCVLSVLMGLKLEDYLIVERSRMSSHGARDVAGLGVGAMLHDVGMLRLPPEVVDRWNATQDEADEAWRAHVQIGYDMVKHALPPAPTSVVLHHHQRFDGSGFPRRVRLDGSEERVAGSDIHVFARIVAVADQFDRLRRPPGRPADEPPVPAVRALKQLLSPARRAALDPMVVKALLAVVPPYAPGTLVTLSDGQRYVVTDWFADDPCRPNVQPYVEPEKLGYGQPPEKIALGRRADLRIAQAEGQDVSADNFYPEFPGQFDLKLAGRALFNGAATRATSPARTA